MSDYTPHRWVILKLTNEDKVHYKVMGGWYGGYLDSAYWRINSGISKVEDDGDSYKFHGHSGSVYTCKKNSYGVTSCMAAAIPDDSRVEVMEEQDFTKLEL